MTAAMVIKILKEVTQWGPVIAEAGKKIYDHTQWMFGNKVPLNKKSMTITVQELDRKVSQLEQNDLDQTKLLSEMAQQTDNLSQLTNVLIRRVKYANIIAGVSLLMAVYLLVRSLT
jgi:hypothetical protein